MSFMPSYEEIFIIILIIIVPLIITPSLLSKKLEKIEGNNDLKKKIKLVMGLSIVSSFLIPLKIYITNCGNEMNTFMKLLNALIAITLMLFISLINGVWWEIYYKYYDLFGGVTIYMLLLSTGILAWVPLSLKNTLWPDELAQCINDTNIKENISNLLHGLRLRNKTPSLVPTNIGPSPGIYSGSGFRLNID